ncbi:MAG: hypothetical protein FWC80_04555 [Firmicutes bacterium]|nr:hypothetical protein [Bacillota bacterium]
MTNKTCCLFGQAKISIPKQAKLSKLLYDQLETLIKDGYTNFSFDCKGDFSLVVAMTVSKLKNTYPFIKMIYHQIYDNEDTNLLEYGYDKIIPPFDNIPETDTLSYRNHSMVDNSDYCIFYFNTRPSSTNKKTLRFAKNLGKPYVNLYDLI